MKYELLKRISKHLAGEIWEIRDNECLFITSVSRITSEYVPSGNWQPYFLRDNANNNDYFKKLDNEIKKVDGGMFVIDPSRRDITTYLADVLYQDGHELSEKVNEIIQAVNGLLKKE
jgi:hypothetical protein